MSKRRIEVDVKIKVNGESLWEKFLKRDSKKRKLEEEKRKLEEEEHRTKEMDLLKFVRAYFKEASRVEWKEDGAIQEDDYAHEIYGSTNEVNKEFEMNYELQFKICFPFLVTSEEASEEEIEDDGSEIFLEYFAYQDIEDVVSRCVIFETRAQFYVGVTGPCSLSPIQLEEMLIAVVKAQVQQPMQSNILTQLECYDFKKCEDLTFK